MSTFPKLSYVCPIPWANLSGDEREKFCRQCGLKVTNLSELTADARAALLARAGQEKLCVSFYRRLSGEYVTPEAPLSPEERSKIKQLGFAALSASALALAAGCVTTPLPIAPAAQHEEENPNIVPKPVEGEGVVVLHAFGMMCEPPKKKR